MGFEGVHCAGSEGYAVRGVPISLGVDVLLNGPLAGLMVKETRRQFQTFKTMVDKGIIVSD